MRYIEIAKNRSELPTPGFKLPFVSKIFIDPVDYQQFGNFVDGREDVEIYELDNSNRDVWVVVIACSSERVRDRIRREWL